MHKLFRDLREPAVLKRIRLTDDEILFRPNPLRSWFFLLFGLACIVLSVALFLVTVHPKRPDDKEIAIIYSIFFIIIGSVFLFLSRIGAGSQFTLTRRTGTYRYKKCHLIKRELIDGPLSDLEGISYYPRYFTFGLTLKKGSQLMPVWTLGLRLKKLESPIIIAESFNQQKIENKLASLTRLLKIPAIYWNGGSAIKRQWPEIKSELPIGGATATCQIDPLPHGSKILLANELSDEKIILSRRIVLPKNRYTLGLAFQQILGGICIIIAVLSLAYIFKLYTIVDINPVLYALLFAGFIGIGSYLLGSASTKMNGVNTIVEDAENLLHYHKVALQLSDFKIYSKKRIKDVTIESVRDFSKDRRQELVVTTGWSALRIGRQLNPAELVWLRDTILIMLERRKKNN